MRTLTKLMRDCFGDGRLVKADGGGFAIEATGLHEPAVLLPSTTGLPVPDLTDHLGQVLSYAGTLHAVGGKRTIENLAIHLADLQIPAEEKPISPMWCVVSGNLGGKPEVRGEDRCNASIAYAGSGEDGSWLRLTVYTYFGIADHFAQLEKGSPIAAYGAMESYVYNDKNRLQLAMRGFSMLARNSSAPKPPIVLMASRGASDIAPLDPFVEAS